MIVLTINDGFYVVEPLKWQDFIDCTETFAGMLLDCKVIKSINTSRNLDGVRTTFVI